VIAAELLALAVAGPHDDEPDITVGVTVGVLNALGWIAAGVPALREQIAELEADGGQDLARLTAAVAVHEDVPVVALGDVQGGPIVIVCGTAHQKATVTVGAKLTPVTGGNPHRHALRIHDGFPRGLLALSL
jgi:hypothetical protein